MPDGDGIAVWSLAAEDLPDGFRPGDRITAIDGAAIAAVNLPGLAGRETALTPGDTVSFIIARGEERVALTCTARAGTVGTRHALRALRVLTLDQAARRKRWLSYLP